ncbi:MAG: flippase-like domain-containing protein [Anaerolineales bacterium]|nr:flippase-like domain-containing protein [Anaerolineales bacterium]
MFAENEKRPSQINTSRWWTWASIILSIILLGIGGWYVLAKISLPEMMQAFGSVRSGYLGLSVLCITLTFLVKAWRWRFLLTTSSPKPSYAALFWAMMLGFYVNIVLPFLRLGEIARAYALNYQTGTSKIQSLSTLVVEKVLEAVFLGLTAVSLLPFLVLPVASQQSNPGLMLGIVAFLVLIVMYLIAFRTNWVLRQVEQLAGWLPTAVGSRFLQLATAGLKGFAALREQRLSLAILGTSLLVAVLSVLTPYFLFPAFGISLGIAEAAAIHVVISLALVPPSTPVKIGIFDGVVAFMLVQFGVESEALIAAYTIVFHLVVVLPQIIFGSIAASRTQWRRQQTAVSAPRSS